MNGHKSACYPGRHAAMVKQHTSGKEQLPDRQERKIHWENRIESGREMMFMISTERAFISGGRGACQGTGRPVDTGQPGPGQLILAQDEYYDFNNYMAGLNDNVLVVGGSGTGKTRSVVRPNLLQATGSYLISDPKGNLYDRYQDYLRSRGYRVVRLDFVHPEKSTAHYNFFRYIHSETDVLKVAHMLSEKGGSFSKDPFWDQSSEILMECAISYLREFCPESDRNFGNVLKFIRSGERGQSDQHDSVLDRLLEKAGILAPSSQAVRCYKSICINPSRTWSCILTAALAKYASMDTAEVTELLSDDTMRFDEIGRTRTAVFVVVSDTDRSLDPIVNVFFSQAMQELCRVADDRKDCRLPVPVRFVLDDFATNVHIDEFPRMISSIRSRGISAMLMVQAEAQLESGYGSDAQTIISNCDSYVYLGGNDISTARRVGERADLPMLDILNMPVGSCWVFRRGQAAHRSKTFPLDAFEKECFETRRYLPDREDRERPAGSIAGSTAARRNGEERSIADSTAAERGGEERIIAGRSATERIPGFNAKKGAPDFNTGEERRGEKAVPQFNVKGGEGRKRKSA